MITPPGEGETKKKKSQNSVLAFWKKRAQKPKISRQKKKKERCREKKGGPRIDLVDIKGGEQRGVPAGTFSAKTGGGDRGIPGKGGPSLTRDKQKKDRRRENRREPHHF